MDITRRDFIKTISLVGGMLALNKVEFARALVEKASVKAYQ